MKPRLKLWRGIWHCLVMRSGPEIVCGLGYSPQDAYADWWRMTRKQWMEQA